MTFLPAAIATLCVLAMGSTALAGDAAMSTASEPPPHELDDQAVRLIVPVSPGPVRDRLPDGEDRGPHGQVGAMVGANGVRGAFGQVEVRPRDNVTVGLAGAYYRGPTYYAGFGPDPTLLPGSSIVDPGPAADGGQ